jgi:hypothetical protein
MCYCWCRDSDSDDDDERIISLPQGFTVDNHHAQKEMMQTFHSLGSEDDESESHSAESSGRTNDMRTLHTNYLHLQVREIKAAANYELVHYPQMCLYNIDSHIERATLDEPLQRMLKQFYRTHHRGDRLTIANEINLQLGLYNERVDVQKRGAQTALFQYTDWSSDEEIVPLETDSIRSEAFFERPPEDERIVVQASTPRDPRSPRSPRSPRNGSAWENAKPMGQPRQDANLISPRRPLVRQACVKTDEEDSALEKPETTASMFSLIEAKPNTSATLDEKPVIETVDVATLKKIKKRRGSVLNLGIFATTTNETI